MSGWHWVALDVIQAVHDRQISEHGGMPGIRDAGLVESAIARPQNLAAYGTPDAADLAATYAYGIAKNHAFSDGNKRTAWVAARLFLRLNGQTLGFEPATAVKLMEGVAGGMISEPDLALWFRERVNATV